MTSSASHGKCISGVIGLGIMLVLVLFVSGCTQQSATPDATTAPTQAGTTATPAMTSTPAVTSSTPGPTQTLPDDWSIEIQVQSNGLSYDPKIITTVRGGKGLNFIQQIDVKVTGTDGVVVTGEMKKPLYVRQEIALRSTNSMLNKDREEVWATDPQGKRVKIFDAYVPFRQY
jgi:hypothetical protein